MNLRWWHFCLALAVSLAVHGAVDVWLHDDEDPMQVAGSANAQIAIIGNATADMLVEGGEFEAGQAAPMAAAYANPFEPTAVKPVAAVAPERPVVPPARSPQTSRLSMAAALPASDTATPIIAAAPIDVTDAERILSTEAQPVTEPTTVEAETSAARVENSPVAEQTPSEAARTDANKASQTQPLDTELQEATQTEEQAQNRPETERIETPDAAAAKKPAAETEVSVSKPADPQKPPTQPVEAATSAVPATAQPVKPAPDVKVQEIKPVETAALIRPIEPVAKPVEKPTRKEVEKPSKKKTAKKGNEGSNKRSAKQGRADGAESGRRDSAGNSQAGNRKGVAGNAAVSNYPGKVQRKLRRSVRYPSKARSKKLRGTAYVRFVVDAGGQVTASGIAHSSGSKVLDAAALATVRRAAPFPKIPQAANRRSWSFTVPVEFTPRR